LLRSARATRWEALALQPVWCWRSKTATVMLLVPHHKWSHEEDNGWALGTSHMCTMDDACHLCCMYASCWFHCMSLMVYRQHLHTTTSIPN
jgi:hypothetical protein